MSRGYVNPNGDDRRADSSPGALAVLVALPLIGSIGWALVGGGLAGAAP